MGSTSNSRSHTTFSRRVDLALPQGTSPWQNSSVGPHSAPQRIFQAFSQHPSSLCSLLFLGSLSAPRNCPHSLSKCPPLLQLSHTRSTRCSLVLCKQRSITASPSKGPSTQRSTTAFSSNKAEEATIHLDFSHFISPMLYLQDPIQAWKPLCEER